MKKAILAIVAAACACAAQADTLQKIRETGVVRMGVRVSSGALSYTTGYGQYVGFHIDLCHRALADIQKHIPEKTPEKVAKAAAFKQARKSGAELPGLSEWNIRWVGEKGYQGIVARQLQEFKKRQQQ